jgi:hypothetical protein
LAHGERGSLVGPIGSPFSSYSVNGGEDEGLREIDGWENRSGLAAAKGGDMKVAGGSPEANNSSKAPLA